MNGDRLDGINAPPHACETMLACLGDPAVPVDYRPQYREYVVWVEKPSDREFGRAQSLLYCPWCGQELPTSLRDQLFDEIDALNGAEEVDDYFEALAAAPARYQSDAWWKGRYDSRGRTSLPR